MTRLKMWGCLAVLLTGSILRADAIANGGQKGEGVPDFGIRAGYKVTLVSGAVNEARFLEVDEFGTLYVSQPRAGSITMLRPQADGSYKVIGTFVTKFNQVHGMQYYKGWLWFTTTGAIHRGKVNPSGGPAEQIETIVEQGKVPSGGGHWWRSILVDDETLYTSIGDNGNASAQDVDGERMKIWQFKADGSGKELFCSGIRNTEKLQYRPGTKEIWGCDHGSDNWGASFGESKNNQSVTDLNPPEEVNLYEKGKFYGHPFITGNKVPRLEFSRTPGILEIAAKTEPPQWLGGAHWANNGFTFLKQNYFPEHQGDMFVAYHGSWNSTQRVGYRVQRVLFDKQSGKPYGALPIVSTLSADGKQVLARPVDCVELADGSVVFSSDSPKGMLFRISKAE